MIRIVVLAHGETVPGGLRSYEPSLPLDDYGRTQADRLRTSLCISFDLVLVSLAKRTKDTARHVAATGTPVEELSELTPGEPPGMEGKPMFGIIGWWAAWHAIKAAHVAHGSRDTFDVLVVVDPLTVPTFCRAMVGWNGKLLQKLEECTKGSVKTCHGIRLHLKKSGLVEDLTKIS